MADAPEELSSNRGEAGVSDASNLRSCPQSASPIAYPATTSIPASKEVDSHKCCNTKHQGVDDVAEPDLSRPVSMNSDESTRCSRRSHMVWLHIYDIDPITARLNESVLRKVNLGAFHCGVEVLGDEWFFAYGETSDTGVTWNEPRLHQVHVYRESLCVGETPLSDEEIRHVIADAMDVWIQDSYHPITRNCVTFAEDLIDRLKVGEPFPAWVRGAPDLGKAPLLFPIADWGWRWIKWYVSETPPPEPIRQPVEDGVMWPWAKCCREVP